MRYLLPIKTGYEHLAGKFERAVLTHVGRDGSVMAICVQSYFVRDHLLTSENGLYDFADTFCHVDPDLLQ